MESKMLVLLRALEVILLSLALYLAFWGALPTLYGVAVQSFRIGIV